MPVIIQFFKNLTPTKLAIIGAAALTFIIIFLVYITKISGKDMGILYSDLDREDSNKIIQELDNKKIPYQIYMDGSIVKVPKNQIDGARLALAQAGLPTKGSIIGYEIFDKEDSIGTTTFSQNIKMIRALEGEISRTISSMEQVDKSRVHLVLPQREIFSKERLEPRASIILKLKNNKILSKTEIDSISHLVLTAVPGLDLKNITILDTKGRSLKLGANENESDLSGLQNEEYRIAYEIRMKKTIEELLEKSLGYNKVKAQVTIDMNFDRIVTNSELYDPDSAVIRSVQSIDERERTPVINEDNLDVSVANNIPAFGEESAQNQNFATIDKNELTTNYEISKTVKNHISETGSIKKLSIGVLIDGASKVNSETGNTEYVARSKEELDKIANLVKVAIGFNADRGDQIEVVNMEFSKDPDLLADEHQANWIKEELPNLFQTLVFAIVIVLVLVTVIRPIALKAFDIKKPTENYAMGENNMRFSASDDSFNYEQEEEKIRAEMNKSNDNRIRKINDLVVSYPQETVSVLRKWLNENS